MKQIGLLLLMTTSMAFATTPPSDKKCAPTPGIVPGGMITINEGFTRTKNLSVDLKLARDGETAKMKISNNDNCDCGTWERFSETKAWTLAAENARNFISIQFKDYEGAPSQCARAWIIHDNLAPTVKLTLDPANSYRSGEDTKLKLDVADNGVGIATVSCKLNGIATSCGTGVTDIVFQKQNIGNYVFDVTSSDYLGNISTGATSWEVKSNLQNISQNLEIRSNNKVDILIIDDNSPSMEYEQKNMAARMNTFLDQLQGLDWQIAFITTDTKSKIWGDGRLLAMKGLTNQYMISSTMPRLQAQTALSNTIQRTETGDSLEQGIFNTYRAIERSLDTAVSPNKSFFRADANLATIVISDEDESATGPKNRPENLLGLIKSTWPSKLFAFHSIITKTGDLQCKQTNGFSFGKTYERLSKMTGAGTIGGAIIGSVCEADYGSQLKGIGQSVQQMQKIMNLQCLPVGPANSSVIVSLDGNNYTAPYEIQGLKLVFSSNLPVGKYILRYQCL